MLQYRLLLDDMPICVGYDLNSHTLFNSVVHVHCFQPLHLDTALETPVFEDANIGSGKRARLPGITITMQLCGIYVLGFVALFATPFLVLQLIQHILQCFFFANS